MTDILLHPATGASLERFRVHPSHAVLLSGPRGIGKGSVSRQLAADLLGTPLERLDKDAYFKPISSGKEPSISIEAVRELEHFLSRKVPGDAQRVVVIEDGHTMTLEAQNALLKTLEEPPLQTTIILTAVSEQSLLPTIRSRLITIPIQRPEQSLLQAHFEEQDFPATTVRQAMLMSGGLPGLISAILQDNTEHPLVQAAVTAREIIQKPVFERLALVDQLAKQKDFSLDVLTIMEQMAHVALSGPKPSRKWQKILTQSYIATGQLMNSAQPKLTLTSLMLNL